MGPTKPYTRRTEEIPACPDCRVRYPVRFVERWQHYQCDYCGQTFTAVDAAAVLSGEKRKRSANGSGVIAGPITIGRGFKWGAGRA